MATSIRRWVASPLLLVLSFSQSLSAQNLIARVDEFLAAEHEVNQLMGSMLIARDDKSLYRKGFGLANVEQGVPNTPHTKFRSPRVATGLQPRRFCCFISRATKVDPMVALRCE